MNPMVILVIMGGLTLTFIFIGLAFSLGAKERTIQKRLETVTARRDKLGVEEAERPEEKGPSALSKVVDKAASRSTTFYSKTATALAQADLKLTVGEFVIFRTTTTLIGGLVAFVLGGIFFVPVGAIGGYMFPRIYINLRKAGRLRAFNNQLGDAITHMANALRAGYSLLQAMETVSKELPPPISEEFGRVVREVGLGIPTEQAMNNMLRRVQSDDLDLMITAINVQHEVGGNLSEILETISHTIRERVRIMGEIRVLTAQGMMTGYVISFLPVALGVILFLINQSYIGSMFQEPCGWAMLGFCVITIGSGFFAIMRIVNIEV